jgi:hypothetical protein
VVLDDVFVSKINLDRTRLSGVLKSYVVLWFLK